MPCSTAALKSRWDAPLNHPHRPTAFRTRPATDCQPGRRGHGRLGRKDLSDPRPPRRQRRISFQLRLPAGLQRQLLAGRQLRGAEQRLAHPRAQWLRSLRLDGPLPDLCQLHQRRRGQDSSPAQPALRRARPAAGPSPLYWGLGSSLGYLGRSEPDFHARNVGRIDFIRISPCRFSAGGWSVVPEAALRETLLHQPDPDLTGATAARPPSATIRSTGPTLKPRWTSARRPWSAISRSPLEPRAAPRHRAGVHLPLCGRHRRPGREMCSWSTPPTSPPTPTKWASRSPSAFICARPTAASPAPQDAAAAQASAAALPAARVGQLADCAKILHRPQLRRRAHPGRRNVFDSTLDLTGIAFLTSPRNLAHYLARALSRPSTICASSGIWTTTPRPGGWSADNIYAGYSWGRTTLGVGHAMLNAVDENGSSASTIKSQQVQPFLAIGKQKRQRLQPGRQRRLRLCPWRTAVRRGAGRLQLGLLRPHLRLPALRSRAQSATKPSGSIASPWPTSVLRAIFAAPTRSSAIPACRPRISSPVEPLASARPRLLPIRRILHLAPSDRASLEYPFLRGFNLSRIHLSGWPARVWAWPRAAKPNLHRNAAHAAGPGAEPAHRGHGPLPVQRAAGLTTSIWARKPSQVPGYDTLPVTSRAAPRARWSIS
jgi:hypothetical protein